MDIAVAFASGLIVAIGLVLVFLAALGRNVGPDEQAVFSGISAEDAYDAESEDDRSWPASDASRRAGR